MRLFSFALALTPCFGAPLYTMTEIGTLGGGFSNGRAINDNGVVAGIATLPSSEGKAFYWDGTSMNLFDSLNSVRSWAWDINNNGITVGTLQDPLNAFSGVVWNTVSGAPVPLPVQIGNFTGAPVCNVPCALPAASCRTLAGGYSWGAGVNSSGSRMDSLPAPATFPPASYHAFFWDGSTQPCTISAEPHTHSIAEHAGDLAVVH